MSLYKLVEIKKKFSQELYPDALRNPNRYAYANLVSTQGFLFTYANTGISQEEQVLRILRLLEKQTLFFLCSKKEFEEAYGCRYSSRCNYKKWLEDWEVGVDGEITRRSLRILLDAYSVEIGQRN